MIELYNKVTFKCSKLVTQEYSTSFSLGIKLLDKSIRNAIYSIYGFVRFADEIVDSFHTFDKEELLNRFEQDYYRAYNEKISLNPILHSFQMVVKEYDIDDHLIQAFLKSMRSDLHNTEFNTEEIREYIYGSADVVGLMCLKVFLNGDKEKYEEMKPFAMSLGSAFQKVNFLRDIKNDVNQLHRVYFPILNDNELTDEIKNEIIVDIDRDYRKALEGIKKLPRSSKKGVFAAYLYYLNLTKKINRTKANKLLNERIRISNLYKLWLLSYSYFAEKMRII